MSSPAPVGEREPGAGSPGLIEPAELSALALVRARGRVRGVLGLLGPAFVAAVAYIDPGNFATNFTAGARFGYLLVWVVVAANLIAMIVQYQSAKLGVVTGRDLPQLCREYLPRPVSFSLWVQAELIAMATDLAEFVGAALGLYLLFGVPLFPAGLITAVVSFAILALEQRGHRRFELAIVALLAVVLLGFLYDLVTVGTSASGVVNGLVPRFDGSDSALLAAGIVGATVMPHVVYLHSALTKRRVVCRDESERRELLRFQRVDVVIALGIAGLINLTMLAVAASLFHGSGVTAVDSLGAAHAGLERLAGGAAALAFAVALLASGLSSSSVGTYAGQVVMQGFIRRRIPLFLRRGLTMLPALIVLAVGLPTTDSLVVSQVLLSFGIPFALIPLAMITRRSDIMGELANHRLTSIAMFAISGAITLLNVVLLKDIFVH